MQRLAVERFARGQLLILTNVIRRRGRPWQDHRRRGQLEQDEQHDVDSQQHPAKRNILIELPDIDIVTINVD